MFKSDSIRCPGMTEERRGAGGEKERNHVYLVTVKYQLFSKIWHPSCAKCIFLQYS